MAAQIVRKLVGGIWRTVEADEAGGGGSQPSGAVWVYPFTDAGGANDALGENGDLALLLDTGTFIQKAGGTWATS